MSLADCNATYLWIMLAPVLMLAVIVVVYMLSRLMVYFFRSILKQAGGG
jgi:hypothetical protein